MDLNIEQQGDVSGWEPPVGDVLSPGFRAVMWAMNREDHIPHSIEYIRVFIDRLEQKGYCIALLPSE